MLSLLIKMSSKDCSRTCRATLPSQGWVSWRSWMLISRASIRIAQTSAPESIRRQPNKRRINMEPTLTQNCALYYAQHKTSKGRAALFKKFRAAARKRRPDVRQQLTFGDLFIVPRLHKDNGR